MLPDAFANRHIERQNLHPSLTLAQLEAIISPDDEKALSWMEETGGEPVVVSLGGGWVIVDASAETPKSRTKCCYDREARLGRKKNPPEISATEAIGPYPNLRLMTEDEYFAVQKSTPLDLKTSSWLYTPDDIRAEGGAIFGDRRFGRVFIFHNTADSYYSSRGFRCVLPLKP